MRSAIALALLASTAPLAVYAQVSPEENLRRLELDRRAEQQRIERQSVEIQRQMDQAVRNLTPLPTPPITYQPPPIIVIQGADERTRLLQAQLAAANARLQALAEAEKKAKTSDAKQAAEKP